ncbi:MAG: cation:proton antiporter [Pseudomonadales bacterium]|nr:cation:proton antiporter [Pseudomonadales bacterium]MBO6596253.1 cation:proton antiporter [Pseudomonadales bacterium]MBO6657211.1 cation:proton antiporter [Pseudomonadales bacterium]
MSVIVALEPLVILLAFVAGLAFKKIGYPPLPGYLLAGFVAHGFSLGQVDLITEIADIGILLLLFTIGLKLNLKDIAAPYTWAVAGLHIGIAVPLTTVVIMVSGIVFPVLALQDTGSAWMLAFALSLSSTVFAVKVFEERGESASFHAKIAIGILVIQDILAVTFLVLSSGQLPAVWAPALLLLVFIRPLLLWLLNLARHSELVILMGFGMALGGAELFEAAGLKGGLGALLFGLILSNSKLTKELYNSLIDLKDLFLIGFFLQIGYYGLPEQPMWFVATALAFLIFLRPVIYYLLFVGFRLRARTSLLASSALFNYSEFGLVVAAYAVATGNLPQEWLTTIALAVSISFFIATPLNLRIHRFYSQYGSNLQRIERGARLKAEVPTDLGDAEVVVLGMGRVGVGAYQRLREIHADNIVGVDENFSKVQEHRDNGISCVHGDASDYDLWAHSSLKDKKLVLISLTKHAENLVAVELAKELGFSGTLAVVCRFPDQHQELAEMGCIVFNLYDEAGHGFAEHVVERLDS